MECYLNGELAVFADEETIDKLKEVFSDSDDVLDEYTFEEYEVEIGEDRTSIKIQFDESYELFRTTDTPEDIMNFVICLKDSFPSISSFVFEGTIDFLSSGEHSIFICGFDGNKATFKTCDYDEDNEEPSDNWYICTDLIKVIEKIFKKQKR